MKITVPVKSVQRIASDAGLPESVVDRYFDALTEIILRAKTQERKQCIDTLRGWWHMPNNTRPPLHDLIDAIDS
jgi:hypothetical protein